VALDKCNRQTATNMKAARVRAKMKTIHTADVDAFATLPQRCCKSDKKSAFYL